jgi:uncharacterized membrane protein
LDQTQLQLSDLTPIDRQGAAAAHLAGIFFPFLGPIVVFALGHRSTFTRYHAVHSLVGMFLLNIGLLVLGAISLGTSLWMLWQHYQDDFQNFSWWQVLLKMAATWIVLLLIGLINMIVNLVQGLRAYRGIWPGKSLTTAIVNRFVKRSSPVSC